MKLYRADKRDFSVGDKISQQMNFLLKILKNQQK